MILMIDNYDSFTYNLVQLFLGRGVEVEVVRNDVEDPEQMLAREPEGVVISPGPGRPEEAGICPRLVGLRRPIPLLGVCLGHQVLGIAFGAQVGQAQNLMHGKTSQVRHNGDGIFRGLPNPFEATRYHSLVVRPRTLPDEIEAVAWSDGETLMGMRHRTLPYWGVQFHPESILTAAGPQLIDNFLHFCRSSKPVFRGGA